jgi:hypothetical protein
VSRRIALVWLLLVIGAPEPGWAQDQALDLLLFARSLENASAPVDARAIQVYRLPLSFRLRSMGERRWGARLTFPVSLSALRIETVSDLPRVVKSLGIAAVVPGIELEIPVGDRLRLRPFAETGIGKGTDGDIEVLYGSGMRARMRHEFRRVHFRVGGSGMYRKLAKRGVEYDGHGTFEAGLDSQIPLGFEIGGKPALGGMYGIARKFNGLELKPVGQEPLVLPHQVEVGVSFATEPDLRIWKILIPWIAAGYQFGPVISGVRVYTSFPF